MERFLTSRGFRNPEWIKVSKNESSQLEIKFYFKASEDKPENGLMASLQRKQALSPIKFSSEIISRSTTLIKF